MTTSFSSVRIVLFVSEQLVPALQFMLHAAASLGGRLASTHLYCTGDERRSRAPAVRLKAIFEAWCQTQDLSVTVEVTEGQMWPSDVRAGLTDWFEGAPDSEWWVNVTGGTKPMSATATELTLATNLQARRVVYREFEGDWVEFTTDEDGLLEAVQLSSTDPVVPPADTLDRLLPLRFLVATQFSAQHDITTSKVQPFPVDVALKSVMAHHWKWSEGLRAIPYGVQPSGNGDAFERFVGAGLLDCGLQVEHSLKVIDADTTDRKAGKPMREVDLVVCHRSRLVLIDIKLPGAHDAQKGTQLADVAELARSLGGNSALAVAIRPGWQRDDDVMRLAKALRVELVCQDDAPRLFTVMLRAIDQRLTPSTAVVAAEAMLREQYLRGSAVLSDGRMLSAETDTQGTLDLEREAERLCSRRGESWLLVRLQGGRYRLCCHRLRYTKSNNEADQHHRLDLLLSELGLHTAPGMPPKLIPVHGTWLHIDITVALGCKADALQATIRSCAAA